MKIDFNQLMTMFDGRAIVIQNIEQTLGTVCADLLLLEDKEVKSATEKIDRYELAKKIYKGGVIDISQENIDKLKGLIEALATVLIAGQTLPMLDTEAKPKPKRGRPRKDKDTDSIDTDSIETPAPMFPKPGSPGHPGSSGFGPPPLIPSLK